MAIKNKDGTVYTLRGPNPILKEMSDWDKEKTRLINLRGKSVEIIVDDASESNNVVTIREQAVPKATDQSKFVTPKEFINDIIEEVKVETPPSTESEPTPVSKPDPVIENLFKTKGVQYYCAPAVGVKSHTDSLYGSTYTTTVYGDKFLFDAIIVEQSDLQIQFWCMIDLAKGSVVYRRDIGGGERWWMMDTSVAKSGGYLITGHVSDLNPDFS